MTADDERATASDEQVDEQGGAAAPPVGFEPIEADIPFVELVGQIYVRGDDPSRLGVRAVQKHANHRGTVMGGMLATLVDFALGLAIAADAEDGKERATVSLTLDYLKAVQTGEWLESHTKVDRVSGTLAFADCSLQVQDREVVRARSVWAALS